MRFRRGLALVLVVGVLAVLAVLGSAFAVLSRLERRAASQRVNGTRALLLARSGIEDALARLDANQDPDATESRYGGEDWQMDGDNGPGTFDRQQEVHDPSRINTEDCPVRHAVRPSFFARDGFAPARPDLLACDGRQRGYSGRLGGAGQAKGNTYALRVLTEGGFYLNGGDPTAPGGFVVTTASGYNSILRRILGVLAEAIDREDGVDDGSPVDQTDGERLIDSRPGTERGWEDWDQVRRLALNGSRAKMDALRPYLTLLAHVDRKVIAPTPRLTLRIMQSAGFSTWTDIKLGRCNLSVFNPNPPIKRGPPDFERIPVLPTGRIVGRAPVSLPWARKRRCALIALLANLKGNYLYESTASARSGNFGDTLGSITSNPAEIYLNWTLPSDECRLAADFILASTSELATWEQFNAFCDTIPFTWDWDVGVKQGQRDLVKANFNPNSDLNKFGPNVSLWKSIDKSDLQFYTTEFSLLPMASPRNLESAGRVLARDGRLLACRVLRVSLSPCSLATLTTQKEFVCEELGDLSVPGDERDFRLPGKTPFISRSQGPANQKTWGHALPGMGTMGASLQTYPEPCVIAGPPGSNPSILPADFDGSVQLATLETADNEFYGLDLAAPPPVLDMKLLARYTAGLDLDLADAWPANPLAKRNQPDVEQVTYTGGGAPDLSQLSYSVWHTSRPNTLYPDGIYSEKFRAPSYPSKGNANGFHGLISFWVKPNYTGPTHQSHRGHPFFKWTNFSAVNTSNESPNQFFYLGDYAGAGYSEALSAGVVCHFEIGHTASDRFNLEHRFWQDCNGMERPKGLTSRRWSLLTMYYDFRSPATAPHDCGELRVNAGISALDRGSSSIYSPNANTPGSAADITQDHLLQDGTIGPHRLYLGAGRPLEELDDYIGCGADATLDELAIYDFGGAGPGGIPAALPTTLESPGRLALERFRRGRYYRESAYPDTGGLRTSSGPSRSAAEYFSPTIHLGGPRRIKALAWTQIVPRGLRAPLPATVDGTWESVMTMLPVPATGQAGVDGDPGPDGTILLELSDVSGAGYLKDAAGNPIDQAFTRSALSPVKRLVNAPFRLHAVFKPNLDDPGNAPILDPLALDDVTVVHEPQGGPRIAAWEPD